MQKLTHSQPAAQPKVAHNAVEQPDYIGQTIDTEIEIQGRFYTFTLLHKSTLGKKVAYWLVAIFIVAMAGLFLPWQQNIRATGAVTAFLPEERPQTVNATIGGRIEYWYVMEGQKVKKGDSLLKIAEIKDKFFDPNLIGRLTEQISAKELAISSLTEKAEALERQNAALRDGLKFSLEKASNKYAQARYKVTIDSADAAAARVDYDVAKLRFERFEELYKKGLKSLTDLEGRKLKLQETEAKLTSAENKLSVVKNELINTQIELSSLRAEYADKIAKSESERNETLYKLGDARAELSKLKNELANVEIRSGYYVIRAPQDGVVVKALHQGVGEILKAGDPVVTIMPIKHDLAVELYVYATDVPLLSPGRKVRLQFDGWPALQFSGWPNISVGTFGGVIRVIDFVNSKEGKYRILVTQDENEEPWPAQLRMGSGVYGWAMLDEVPVWFEIWRQLNGFPPSLRTKPDDNDTMLKEKAKESKDEE